VVFLFGSDYSIERQYCDNRDRMIIARIKNDKHDFIVANMYCSNNFIENNSFIEEVYENLLIFSHESPESNIITMGDMNVCLNQNDFINRRHVLAERELAQHIMNNNEVLNIKDAYRSKIGEGGFTWTRGECFSRLDYVFISDTLLRFIIECSNDWAFSSSDHAAVRIDLHVPELRATGPGIMKLNTTILNNPIWFKKVEDRLKHLIAQIPNDWNPHVKLEYVKMSIRSVFAEVVGESKSEMRKDESVIEGELNFLIDLKQKLLVNSDVSQKEKTRRSATLSVAIDN
jgi:hypothetical protein